MERANKLLYEWQLKGKEIQDKTKYCNAVWVRIGKVASGENYLVGTNRVFYKLNHMPGSDTLIGETAI